MYRNFVICDKAHVEIVHTEGSCPLCDEIVRKEDCEKELKELKEDFNKMYDEHCEIQERNIKLEEMLKSIDIE